ncbi:glycosyltransferase [Prosthecobacter sp.]|uniref:glycosyltransferase n=1 Tax=Prosthecobacter sp. TaxID=1965333 RepID=UPI0037831018
MILVWYGKFILLMHILVVYPYIPYPIDRGTYQRVFHLLRELARDHTIDLIALSEKGERVEHRSVFETFCRKVVFVPFVHPPWPRLVPNRLLHALPTTIRHWWLPQLADTIGAMLDQNEYDMVHVCDIVMAQYFLKSHLEIPLSVDRSRVDLQFQEEQYARMPKELKSSLLYREQVWKLRRFEHQVARRSAVQVVCGPDDERFIRSEVSRKVPVAVITNGVDLDYFSPDAAPARRDSAPTVLYCGAMDYMPNVDALRWYFEEIHARLKRRVPDLKVLIVGTSPVDEVKAYGALPDVTVTGGVPDVRPWYRRAWAQIVPLRIGGGTRLKIPESMAMGTPVISTTIGAQGLNLTHGTDILLADTPEMFAHYTERMLHDETLRQRIEERGMQTCRGRFGWPGLGRQLSRYYSQHFQPARNSHEHN